MPDRALAQDPEHQVARWRHTVDWWSGKIVPWISDATKARNAVEQVRYWTERLCET
jgi:hypothetical protein